MLTTIQKAAKFTQFFGQTIKLRCVYVRKEYGALKKNGFVYVLFSFRLGLDVQSIFNHSFCVCVCVWSFNAFNMIDRWQKILRNVQSTMPMQRLKYDSWATFFILFCCSWKMGEWDVAAHEKDSGVLFCTTVFYFRVNIVGQKWRT